MKTYLLFCSFFPKPISGNANISKSIYICIKKNIKKLVKLDYGNLDLKKNLFIEKLYKCIKNFLYLLKFNKKFQIYYVKNDGEKTIYDFFFLLLALIKGVKKIYLHHHSYKYITNINLLNYFLFYIIRYRAVHIFSDCLQRQKFKKKYPIDRSIMLNNVHIIKNNKKKYYYNNQLIKIGYFSYISKEKGLEIFFETLEFLKKHNIKFKAFIAGDVDPKIARWFSSKLFINNKFCIFKKDCNTDLKKKKFFNSIDMLLFSAYNTRDSYPVSILESFSFGVPVIANNIGSISHIVNNENGRLVKDVNNYKHIVYNELSNLKKKNYLNKSKNCFNFIKSQKKISQFQLLNFKNFLLK
jgi:glycosyltransferase involved in cell wall biosynthesis